MFSCSDFGLLLYICNVTVHIRALCYFCVNIVRVLEIEWIWIIHSIIHFWSGIIANVLCTFLCFCVFILQTFALEYNIDMFSFPCFILHIFKRYLFVIYCYYLSVCLLLLIKITVSQRKQSVTRFQSKINSLFGLLFYNKQT